MKSRGLAFLFIWLLCLAVGIAVGFITGFAVQELNPSPPDDEGNMAYGFYVLVFVLGAANLTHFGVAVFCGARYAKREQNELGRYLAKAIGASVGALALSMFVLPLLLLNSFVAAGIAVVCVARNTSREAVPAS